jgi:hypothetical protein
LKIKRGIEQIKCPKFCLLGACADEWFVNYTKELDYIGGIWTRTSFIYIPEPKAAIPYTKAKAAFTLDSDIQKALKELNDLPLTQMAGGQMDFSQVDSKIDEWSEQHYKECQQVDSILLAKFRRFPELLHKYISIFNLMEFASPAVQTAALDDGVEAVEWQKKDLLLFAEKGMAFTPYARSKAKVLSFIQKRGLASKGDIDNYTNLPPRDLNPILEQLTEGGKIERIDVLPGKKGGHPGTNYKFLK